MSFIYDSSMKAVQGFSVSIFLHTLTSHQIEVYIYIKVKCISAQNVCISAKA